METALVGIAVTIFLAIIGSSWRLSSQIKGIESKVDGVTQRLDRVDPEALRDRVTRIEAKCPMCNERRDT